MTAPIKHTIEAASWITALQDEVRNISMTSDSLSERRNADAMLSELSKALDAVHRAGAYHLPTLQVRLSDEARFRVV